MKEKEKVCNEEQFVQHIMEINKFCKRWMPNQCDGCPADREDGCLLHENFPSWWDKALKGEEK